MSRLVIPATDKDGNIVYFESSEHDGKDVIGSYAFYQEFISKSGFTQLKKEVNSVSETVKEAERIFGTTSHDLPDVRPTDLGKCRKCGAPNKWSDKSNKPYCSQICWKK